VAVATVVGAFVYSYGYLRISVGEWPPEGVADPPLRLGLLWSWPAALVLAVAQLPRWGPLVRLGAGVAIGAAFLASLLAEAPAWTEGASETAYGAIVAVLWGSSVLLAAVALVASVVGWRWHRSDRYPEVRRAHAVAVTAFAWWFALGCWATVWAVMQLGARFW
jgi:hypothetical protein